MAEKLTVLGARGASATELARKTGNWGVLPTDTDYQALEKFGDYAIQQNPAFKSDVPGPADNTYRTLALFKASDINRATASLVGADIPDGRFNWTAGNYTGQADDVNIIKADSTALSAGAWVRQRADGVSFLRTAVSAVTRSIGDWLDDQLSVMDFIPFAERVKIRMRTSTADVSYAFRAALTASAARGGQAVNVPSGLYRAYLLVEQENVTILGAGSSSTTIKLPDGAQHTIPDNNAGAGPMVTGTPCVLDFGNIGTGNDATARSGAHVSGLTLDGNKANTTPPTLDLFGWGMVFTKYSGVSYDDVVAVDCHAGGIGTFINSNYHRGTNWQASRCGFNLGHPGFDVNSSKYSVWQGVVDACREGARLLDNCRNNSLDVSVASCDRTGFIYGNQITGAPGTGNFSENNDVMVRVDGGCSVAGVQVGAKCASGTIVATIANVTGVGLHEVKQTNAADNPRGIHYQISTIRGGQGSCIVGGDSGVWAITSLDDGGNVPAGSAFAVDVFGDRNVLQVTYQDANTKLRGVQFNAGADDNRLISYTYGNSVQPLQDMGSGNRIAVPDSGWAAATGTPSKGTFAAAPAGTVSAAYVQAEAQTSRDRIATLEAQVLAVRQVLAKAGITNA